MLNENSCHNVTNNNFLNCLNKYKWFRNLTTLSWVEYLFAKYYFLVLCVLFTFVAVVSAYNKYFTHAMSVSIPFAATSMFALFAYKYTKEKLRLDLFDRRFEALRAIHEFISLALEISVPKEPSDFVKLAEKAAQACRGINLHKLYLLFGSDMKYIFDDLNAAYSCLASFPKENVGSKRWDKWASHMDNLEQINKNLYVDFSAYVDFGEYKKL
jgi:hypothetical protein